MSNNSLTCYLAELSFYIAFTTRGISDFNHSGSFGHLLTTAYPLSSCVSVVLSLPEAQNGLLFCRIFKIAGEHTSVQLPINPTGELWLCFYGSGHGY